MTRRRQFLRAGGVGLAAGMAGCLSFLGLDGGETTDTPTSTDNMTDSDPTDTNTEANPDWDGPDSDPGEIEWGDDPGYTGMLGNAEINEANEAEEGQLEVFYTDVQYVGDAQGKVSNSQLSRAGLDPMIVIPSVAHTEYVRAMKTISDESVIVQTLDWGQGNYDWESDEAGVVEVPDDPFFEAQYVVRCNGSIIFRGDLDYSRLQSIAAQNGYEYRGERGEFHVYQKDNDEGADLEVFAVSQNTFVYVSEQPKWGGDSLDKPGEGESTLLPVLHRRIDLLQGDGDRITRDGSNGQVIELLEGVSPGAFHVGLFGNDGNSPLYEWLPDDMPDPNDHLSESIASLREVGDEQSGVVASYYVLGENEFGADMTIGWTDESEPADPGDLTMAAGWSSADQVVSIEGLEGYVTATWR